MWLKVSLATFAFLSALAVAQPAWAFNSHWHVAGPYYPPSVCYPTCYNTSTTINWADAHDYSGTPSCSITIGPRTSPGTGCDSSNHPNLAGLADDSYGVSWTASDTSGHSSSGSGTVIIDNTAPTISATATAGGSPYTSGTWTNQDVIVTFTCSDGDGSGLAAGSPPAPVTISTEGASQSVTRSCSDNLGHVATATFSGIKIDKTVPDSHWHSAGPFYPPSPCYPTCYETSTTTNWADIHDNLSGPGSCSLTISATTVTGCGTTLTVHGPDGSYEVSWTATDRAGNTFNGTGGTVILDNTPPSISASATAGGSPYTSGAWTNQDVTVTFNCSDSGSGLAPGSPPAPVTVSTEGAGQSVARSCSDNLGHVATSTFSGINIDKTLPTIQINVPVDGASYIQGDTVLADWSATDALSGIATATGPVSSGSPIDTQTLGSHTFEVTAKDRAGNATSKQVAYTVVPYTPEQIQMAVSKLEPMAKVYQPGAPELAPVLSAFKNAVMPDQQQAALGANQPVTLAEQRTGVQLFGSGTPALPQQAGAVAVGATVLSDMKHWADGAPLPPGRYGVVAIYDPENKLDAAIDPKNETDFYLLLINDKGEIVALIGLSKQELQKAVPQLAAGNTNAAIAVLLNLIAAKLKNA